MNADKRRSKNIDLIGVPLRSSAAQLFFLAAPGPQELTCTT
jgi:hypothetical protein